MAKKKSAVPPPVAKASPFVEATASPFVEAVAANASRADVWLAALVRNSGNITHASAEFDFSKQRGYKLTKKYGFSEEAAAMREAATGNSMGRPKGS